MLVLSSFEGEENASSFSTCSSTFFFILMNSTFFIRKTFRRIRFSVVNLTLKRKVQEKDDEEELKSKWKRKKTKKRQHLY